VDHRQHLRQLYIVRAIVAVVSRLENLKEYRTLRCRGWLTYKILTKEDTTVNARFRLLVICMSVMPMAAWSSGQNMDKALLTQVRIADLANMPVDLIVFEVARIAGVRVAVESSDSPVPESPHPSLGSADKQSVASILDSATASDGRYTWTYVNGWIHLIPRNRPSDYALDRPFQGSIPSDAGMLTQIREVVDSRAADQWQIGVARMGPCCQRSEEREAGVSAPKRPCTVRDVVDYIVARAGGLAWSLQPRKDDGGKVIGTSLLVSF